MILAQVPTLRNFPTATGSVWLFKTGVVVS
jgi:hypothetical protein